MTDFVDDGFDEAFCNLSDEDLTVFDAASKESDAPIKSDINLNLVNLAGIKSSLSHCSKTLPSNKEITNEATYSLSFLHEDKTICSADVSLSKGYLCKSDNDTNGRSPSCIISRFKPGFTPKAKKRKFPGPAGLLFEPSDDLNTDEDSSDVNLNHPKLSAFDFQNIISSQFSEERLSLLPWQKLQTDVSSRPNLLSAAGYYSISRILMESSKKKMPKYMVVPVLCVLIKSISHRETSSVSVFMDDTGEINGKISEDVLTIYKKYMLEGTALILKDVTFLCNLLMLKSINIISIYLSDGSVNHVQPLELILNNKEPLKSKDCGLTAGLQNDEIKNNTNIDVKKTVPFSNVRSMENSNCVNHVSRNELTAVSISCKLDKREEKRPKLPSCFKNPKTDCSAIEDTLSDDNLMDEFDELFVNLDEDSIMADM